MNKRFAVAVLAACLLFSGCSEKTNSEIETIESPEQVIDLTVWHYYNGPQKAAFDHLVAQYNETAGKERGIFVKGHSKGEVPELEDAVMASARKEVGSDKMPDIFSSYADTAYEVEKAGMLAELDPYFTEEEQSQYLASYIEEGRIGKTGELKIFPVAKSTEVLMMNKTLWDEFASETGADAEELSTNEGMARVAEAYYNWTDAKTPDIPNDGKAFYGRDAMANLFIIGSMQFGVEIFQVENQKVTLNIDRDVFKKVWDTYYTPYIKGYFAAYGRFRSDDVKIGELVAYTGSVASAGYFPDQVEIGDQVISIECAVMPAPRFEAGEPYIIQQGAGMVVTKSNSEREAAAVDFLKWFTEAKKNTEFSAASGYLPVRRDACNKEIIDDVVEEQGLDIPKKTYDTILTAYEMLQDDILYTNRAFDGGTKARRVLEYNLPDKAAADRKEVEALLEGGVSLDEAVADYVSEAAFDAWFEEISQKLRDCAAGL